jgi:rod shape determining protein RodA
MKLNFLNYKIQFDLINFLLISLLCLIGLVCIYSSTHTATQAYPIFFKKQLLGIIVGLLIYLKLCNTDYRLLTRQGYFLYILTIGLLIFTTIKGTIGMGAKRWINLGFLKFQPSELTKLFLPAYVVCKLDGNLTLSQFNLRFYEIFAVLIPSTLLIIKQPDLGTGIVLFVTGFSMLWLSSINHSFLKYFIILTIISAPIGWKMLHTYQKKRIEVFLGFGDNSKEAYHIQQSKIAIGSGGIVGKGFMQGTQNKLSFLPESRTDFIFAVICEEFGLRGALLVLALYLMLFFRLLWQISAIPLVISQLLAIGLLLHTIVSTIINIGMVMGLMPIVGIPLPLMSYGLSNLWITLASLGWVQSVIMAHKKN